MNTIVVTGAAGAVGSRVLVGLSELLNRGELERVLAVDRRRPPGRPIDGVEFVQADLKSTDLAAKLGPCDTIIHLADERSEPPESLDDREARAVTLLDRVLAAADDVGCRHLVLLSSALVYGARPDNPVPLTEAHPARPITSLSFAMVKHTLEQRAAEWSRLSGAGVAVLRPAATLSEGDSSWVGAAIRAAAAIRPEGIDPPVQFLHHDDLASAVILAAVGRLDGIYNVAPDGWIGAELFRGLRGEAHVRLPEPLSRVRNQMAKAVAGGNLLDGLEPYVTYPWVVANDKLKAEGWTPSYDNAEAYVAGTAPPLLSSIGPQRRQELALGVLGAAGVAVVGALAWSARRVVR